ncbi:MAG: aminotransferase class III-fold pyridoxal phosphate-dependent enzyme [Chloroflexota bacterium]|nr:aminotransferase class III-fold pyridoxal phosphate-dependent enzyme [Chloroflexota bacterium]MDE3193390.1 aminotransferase class III-fold pyridoxal phosphate-dependent enzyme [Chloroflexota bacterium]
MAVGTKPGAGVDTAQVARDTREHVLISWAAQGQIAPLVVTGGDGCWIVSGERRILDFSSTLVNTNLGHQHPKVVRAIAEQAERLTYAAPGFTDEPRATLARMIADVAPGDLTKTMFTTGGSEAIESAIKIARLFTGRHKVLTQWRSFHGQTAGAMTAGGDNRRWANEPGIPGIVHFLNPDPYRSLFGADVQKALAHVEEVIWYEGPNEVAAILCEPIVGASGLIVPPDGFFQGIRQLCDRHGIVMILDEVMTGFGRTGKWFAAEHWNVVPDVMTFAKGVNSGYVPLGGAIVDGPIAKHFEDHVLWQGLTYSGHALACAAGVATIQAYRDERVVENAAAMGELLGRELRALMARHPSVGDVRGKGLMWGIELVKDRGTKEMLERWNGPSQKLATALRTACMERDVYVMTRWNLMVVAPPLIITADELRTGIGAIDEALAIADRYAATGEL